MRCPTMRRLALVTNRRPTKATPVLSSRPQPAPSNYHADMMNKNVLISGAGIAGLNEDDGCRQNRHR